MNCQQLISYLSDYIDHDLDEELNAEAQQHLATCHNCHVVLDTTQRTILLYREANRGGIPQERRGRLFDRLQQSLANRPNCP
jgi:anti-sigma factor RsiW